jgi:hypothetical protein
VLGDELVRARLDEQLRNSLGLGCAEIDGLEDRAQHTLWWRPDNLRANSGLVASMQQ